MAQKKYPMQEPLGYLSPGFLSGPRTCPGEGSGKAEFTGKRGGKAVLDAIDALLMLGAMLDGDLLRWPILGKGKAAGKASGYSIAIHMFPTISLERE